MIRIELEGHSLELSIEEDMLSIATVAGGKVTPRGAFYLGRLAKKEVIYVTPDMEPEEADG